MTTTDYANRRVGYRVLASQLVQRSTDGGRRWQTVLSPGSHPRLRDHSCHPARYGHVDVLRVAGLFPNALLIASRGVPGNSRANGCDAATGGVFMLYPDGHGGLRSTAALASGLPYAQAPIAHTVPHTSSARKGRNKTSAPSRMPPLTYNVIGVTSDPTNPSVFYADAPGAPRGLTGHGSPPPGLYRSTDGGLHWQAAMRGLPNGSAYSTITVDPAHGAILFDVVGTALYRSVDRGSHWTAVHGVAAARSIRVFVNPANPALVYALTDRGLYHSRDMGATWTLLRARGLPSARAIRTLSFDSRSPSLVLITPQHGRTLRVRESHVPAPPHFDQALTLMPRLYDRVVLSLHAAPRTKARLTVVRGANRTSARLTTGPNGFGYATVELTGHVAPNALRVRIETTGRPTTLKPWFPAGYVPGPPPPPPATPTPTMTPTATPTPTGTATSTPSPTATLTPTATASPTAAPSSTIAAPTAYPASDLSHVWTWQQRVRTLPLCPAAGAPSPLTATASASATPSATPSPTETVTPSPSPSPTTTAATPVSGTPSADETATSTPTLLPTDSPTASPTATATPIGPCDAGPPSPRQDYAAGWDNANRLLYVFGGTNSKTAGAYNDISSYSAITNGWTLITPVDAPPPARYGASSAWDPTLNALLVFGGLTGAGPYAHFFGDVWAYTPATNAWTNLSAGGVAGAPAPSPRAHAAAAWDATNNRLLIFGGQTNDLSPSALTNDLWAFTPTTTGGTWTQLSPNSGDQSLPPPRQWAQIGWDGSALRLFGGKDPGNGAMSDTWTWTPSGGWAFTDVADQPTGAGAAAYTWDDTHGRFVIGPGLGLNGANTDVWSYDASANDWAQVPVAGDPAPAPRQMARMVWDAADNQALLFGGREVSPGVPPGDSNDLWALVPTGAPAPAPTPTVLAQVAKGADLGQTVGAFQNTVILPTQKLDAIATSGATYARVSFDIGSGATTWTPARLHAYEQVVKKLNARGITVLAVAASGITGGWPTGSWTQNAQETTGGNGDNPAIENYVQQLKVLVSHFYGPPYNVRHWELWNEPNVALSGCVQADPTARCLQQPSLQPSNFAALLAESYTAIKGNGPDDLGLSDVQLISGGIFAHSINGIYTPTNAGANYIAATYDEGINKTGQWAPVKASLGTYPLDLVGDHLYVDQGQRTTPALVRTYLDWFHDAYAGNDPGKGIAVTEAGWRTGDVNQPHVSQDIQALNLDTTFTVARHTGFVQLLSWFELQDNPADRNSTSWGLVDSTGNPKLAYQRFQGQ